MNWTLQNSQRSLPTATTFADSAMSPRHLVNIKWDKYMPRAMMFTNELRYQSDQFQFDNRQGTRIPGFYIWNARFSIRILAADMFVAVDNITRRRYAETATNVLFPQPDRSYWTGVSIRFIN
jgi:outer membrane receptor protein involved in Fe transport